ncbi:perlucin-like protein [Mytilus galloprovincialis]|uniref:C-type lectin 6 n=1 Tax=Mytilus galloprovincialis TaxID=29158 RepID=A0A0C5PRJ5_MYTGA|nr:C-type lectin 6 [Mytilus galloprovincialis]
MFLSVILVACCISMIETITCDRSEEKAILSKIQSMSTSMQSSLASLENKINDNSCECGANEIKCPDGWKKYKGHCYFFSPDGKTWHDAEKQCTNMGGYLAKITDSAENSWVVDMLNKSAIFYHGFWMGMTDLKKEGEWRWVDGSSVRFYNWSPNQPDDNNNREDCGHFWSLHHYEWNDAPCNLDNMGYICECSHELNCRPFDEREKQEASE